MTSHILITGASSGIGQALAIQAAKKGYKLSLCGRNPDKLAKTLNLLPDGSQVYQDTFCVTDHQKINEFVKQAKLKNGPIDLLINCAGLNNARGQGHEIDISALDWMMQINCYAPIAFCQAVVPQMKAQQSGKIVNILSTVCLYANPGIAAYSASKSAFDSYTKVMRKELRADNIHFMSVYPGGVDTEFREAQRPQYLTAKAVATAILNNLNTDGNTHIHELILRPQVEENF